MSIARALARMLDPALWFTDAGISDPDGWQIDAMRSKSKRQLWNIHRQGGKSTTAALKALEKAVQVPGSPILVISPALQQSKEMIRECMYRHSKVEGLPRITQEAVHRIEFENRSRIISVAASENMRGFAKVSLLILDESARIVPDSIAAAALPAF